MSFNVFVVQFVEFFEKYGTPEEEIDRINELGPRARPTSIGSCITLSDSTPSFGWYFPCEVPLEVAMDAAERCDAAQKLMRWAMVQSVPHLNKLGRDMKPHQLSKRNTDFKFTLPGATARDQLIVRGKWKF